MTDSTASLLCFLSFFNKHAQTKQLDKVREIGEVLDNWLPLDEERTGDEEEEQGQERQVNMDRSVEQSEATSVSDLPAVDEAHEEQELHVQFRTGDDEVGVDYVPAGTADFVTEYAPSGNESASAPDYGQGGIDSVRADYPDVPEAVPTTVMHHLPEYDAMTGMDTMTTGEGREFVEGNGMHVQQAVVDGEMAGVPVEAERALPA